MAGDDSETIFDGSGDDFLPPPVDPAEEIDRGLVWEEKNDAGNAVRLIRRHGDNMRYVPSRGWFVWDGTRWRPDPEGLLAQNVARDTAARIRQEAEAISVPRLAVWLQQQGDELSAKAAYDKAHKIQDAHRRWAVSSGNQRKIQGMLAIAQGDLMLDTEALDQTPFLLNVANGTLDLRAEAAKDSGFVALRDFDRADNITQIAHVEYQPEARAPLWHIFLDRILPDPAVQTFVQRYFGYILTGSIEEQCLCFFLGRGSNGKSTMMDVIAEIMGDYCKSLPVESLLHNDRGLGASPDLARLPGARFVRASEPEVNSRFSTAILKSVTGGEKLAVRELYKGVFEYVPHFKLVIAANNKPQVRGGDDGIWRRIHLVPFTVRVPKGEIDPDLKEKLLLERSGILNWMLDGYRQWRDLGGLATPDVISAATDDYRDDQDPVSVFMRDCLVTVPGEWIAARRMYEVYTAWCADQAIKAFSETAFGSMVKERGLDSKKRSGRRYIDVAFTGDAPVNSGETYNDR